MVFLFFAVQSQLKVFEFGIEVNTFNALEKVYLIVEIRVRLHFTPSYIVLATGLVQQLLRQPFVRLPELLYGV